MKTPLAEKVRNASWEKTQDGLGRRQLEVLGTLRQYPEGLTAWELAALLDRPIYVVRPRVTELDHMGMVSAVGTRYHAPTQRNETVWRVVTPSGQMDLL